ncbi:MAG: hypothetical protein WC558_06640 [Patulibacter sp.]
MSTDLVRLAAWRSPIRAASFAVATLTASLAFASPALAGPAPANDQLAGAQEISALPAEVVGTTVDATVGVDEPSPFVVQTGDQLVGLDRSVWFRYVATFDGNVLLDACDSNFDNFVNVFRGPAGALRTVATKSNAYRACRGDRQLFSVSKGETYSIRVATERSGSFAPQGGIFRLRLQAQTAPANDAFARATPLTGSGTGAFDVPLAFSTLEFGESNASRERGSVWYRITPTASRPYRVQAPASSAVSTLQVYEARGRTINGLRRVGIGRASDYDAARVDFNAIKGRSYLVRVATRQQVPTPVKIVIATNSASGVGLLITPERNTLSGLRRSGFKAAASCNTRCRVSIALYVSAKDAIRRKLVTGKPTRRVRIGRLSGTLDAGGSTRVTVPLTSEIARRLRGSAPLKLAVEARVVGAKKGGSVRVTETVR